MAMLMVISPAKSLDFESPIAVQACSQPDYVSQANALVALLQRLSQAQLMSLMDISEKLAAENVDRYRQWQAYPALGAARQALLAFDGDVYAGLDAKSFNDDDLMFAQQSLRILSGLYGILRPLDLIQPHRLEMGTRLVNPEGKDLYVFWRSIVAPAINQILGLREPVLINLASEEYFKAVALKQLKANVIQPVFEDGKAGVYKVISFYAKRARGLMARYAIKHRLRDAQALKAFDSEGYRFAPEVSTDTHWVFRRDQVGKS